MTRTVANPQKKKTKKEKKNNSSLGRMGVKGIQIEFFKRELEVILEVGLKMILKMGIGSEIENGIVSEIESRSRSWQYIKRACIMFLI